MQKGHKIKLLERIAIKNRKKLFRDYLFIIVGSAIVAAGYIFFITPFKIIPGGVYGISIILHYLTEGMFSFLPNGLPIGITALCFNIPLWIAALKLLGPNYGPKTVVTFVSTSFFSDFFSCLQGASVLVKEDPLLASIYGGALLGLGVSLIFKAKATSAGTDVLSKILSRYTHIPLGYMIIILDSFIVLLGLLAFRSWEVPLYSWITIFVYGKVVDVFMEGVRTEKAVLIISEKNAELREAILFNLKRGGTLLSGKGLFSGEEKDIIYTVVPKSQVDMLKEIVNEVDTKAFITVLPAYEILGQGFRNLDQTVKESK